MSSLPVDPRECPSCYGDPHAPEEAVYGRNAAEATRPCDCKTCGLRNPNAHRGASS